MTISQTQQEIILKLDKLNLTNPQLEADFLLSFVLKKPREWLLAHPEFKLTKFQILKIKNLVRQRIKGKSLALLTKKKEFYGLKFKVNKHVLVPRPETEMMVDVVLELITRNSQLTTIVDVGTGSGCIVIALAKKLKGGKFIAIDISRKALNMAKENAKFHNLHNIKFLQGNLMSPIIKELRVMSYELRVVICANLPYLTPNQLKDSSTIKFEPQDALVGGSDGLKYYRELFSQLKLLPNKNITVLCEIDHSQSEAIAKLVKKELPDFKIEIKKDLCGLERLVIIEIKK